MKKLFTRAALAALSLSALSAQAQFTVNGTLAAAEIGTGLGKYQLVNTYTGTHSVADRGLKALYMGATATTLNVFVQASTEQTSYSAIVLFLDLPNGAAGYPAGTRLPGGDDNSSQLRMRPTLDQSVDVALRVTLSPLAGGDVNCYHSILNYRGTPNATTGRYPERYLGPTNKTGGSFVISDPLSNIVGGSVAYQTTATGSVAANTATGWELSIPFASLGAIPAGSIVRAMVAYVQDNTEFTTDVMPQVAGRTTIFGIDPNFATIAGTQSVAYEVGTGVLSSRTQASALAASVFPNPMTAASQLGYTVPAGAQPVQVAAYNALGQQVAILLDETQATGPHRLALNGLRGLAAGHYLLRLQVGGAFSSQQVVVE